MKNILKQSSEGKKPDKTGEFTPITKTIKTEKVQANYKLRRDYNGENVIEIGQGSSHISENNLPLISDGFSKCQAVIVKNNKTGEIGLLHIEADGRFTPTHVETLSKIDEHFHYMDQKEFSDDIDAFILYREDRAPKPYDRFHNRKYNTKIIPITPGKDDRRGIIYDPKTNNIIIHTSEDGYDKLTYYKGFDAHQQNKIIEEIQKKIGNIADATKKEEVENLSQDTLPPYIKMYEVSGQEKISLHSFYRYQRDKEQDEAIKQQIGTGILALLNRKNLSQDEIENLIKRGLKNADTETKTIVAKQICKAPEGIQKKLNNILVETIRQGLNNPDIRIQESTTTLKAFLSGENNIKEIDDIIAGKIKEGLNNPDINIQKIAAKMIHRENDDTKEIMNILSKKIRTYLSSKHIEEQSVAIEMIYSIKESEERYQLMKIGLENPYIEIQKKAAEMIGIIPPQRKKMIRELITKKIREGLNNSDIKIQNIAAEMSWIVQGTNGYEIRDMIRKKIRLGLKNPNIEVQKVAVQMSNSLTLMPQDILHTIIKKGLGEEIIKPALYNIENNEASFFRRKFKKTGSGTTLLGNDLKGKTIIRHIEPEAFLSWQKAYEDHTVWKNAGFNYVPIEPIQSYRINQNGIIDVCSSVLDINLEQWKLKTDLFRNDLDKLKIKILNTLDKMSIHHGHARDKNICLRFFRDAKGNIDFKKTPRLYLIDFDQAISPK